MSTIAILLSLAIPGCGDKPMDQTVPKLIEMLQGQDDELRRQAAAKLRKMVQRQRLPSLR
jgi:hypothetical protein